jgi:hypothetical protein
MQLNELFNSLTSDLAILRVLYQTVSADFVQANSHNFCSSRYYQMIFERQIQVAHFLIIHLQEDLL